jgi:hypothetical protein
VATTDTISAELVELMMLFLGHSEIEDFQRMILELIEKYELDLSATAFSFLDNNNGPFDFDLIQS